MLHSHEGDDPPKSKEKKAGRHPRAPPELGKTSGLMTFRIISPGEKGTTVPAKKGIKKWRTDSIKRGEKTHGNVHSKNGRGT